MAAPPVEALSVGTSAPDFALPSNFSRRTAPAFEPARAAGRAGLFSAGLGPEPARKASRIPAACSPVRGFGGELLGLTRDGLWCQAAFADGPLAFPLLSEADTNGDAALAFGVAGRQALFLLDGDGVIQWRYVAAPGQSPRAEDLIAGLSALAPAPSTQVSPKAGLSRREFLAAALGAALVLSLPGSPARAADTPAMAIGADTLHPPSHNGHDAGDAERQRHGPYASN